MFKKMIEKRVEQRMAQYSDLVTEQLVNQSFSQTYDVKQGSVAGIAANLFANCFAVAKLTPEIRFRNLSASLLAHIARTCILYGESIWKIVVDRDGLRLFPCTNARVLGGYDPDSWMYEVTLAGPTVTTTQTLQSSEVVHFRFMTDSKRPWLGVSPLAKNSISAKVENALYTELNSPSGYLLPWATLNSSQAGNVPNELVHIENNLMGLNGRIKVVLANVMRDSLMNRTTDRDPQTVRLGARPPDSLVNLLKLTIDRELDRCGIPSSLVASGEGSASREGFRRFIVSSVIPFGKRISAELQTKIPTAETIDFDFAMLHKFELANLARAAKGLAEVESADQALKDVGIRANGFYEYEQQTIPVPVS